MQSDSLWWCLTKEPSHQPMEKSGEDKEHHRDETSDTSTNTASMQSPQTTQIANDSEKLKARSTRPEKPPSKKRRSPIVVFNGLLVLFTGLYAAATVYGIYATERAAVTFGASDGQLMKLVCRGDRGSLFTYFQNTGKTSASNVWIEVWPLYNDEAKATDIAAYRNAKTQSEIPPGFPYIAVWNGITCADIKAIQSEKKLAIIFGRISYTDDFYRSHCEAFAALYYGTPVNDFEIFPVDLSLCDGLRRKVSWRHVVGGKNGTADAIEEELPTVTKTINGQVRTEKHVWLDLNGYQN
jgi:hypothetical protein